MYANSKFAFSATQQGKANYVPMDRICATADAICLPKLRLFLSRYLRDSCAPASKLDRLQKIGGVIQPAIEVDHISTLFFSRGQHDGPYDRKHYTECEYH